MPSPSAHSVEARSEDQRPRFKSAPRARSLHCIASREPARSAGAFVGESDVTL